MLRALPAAKSLRSYYATCFPRYRRRVVAVSLGSITDPHQQHLLRGHDMEISALAVSPSGSLIATGDNLIDYTYKGD